MRRPLGQYVAQLDHPAVFGRRELARGLVEIRLADDRVAPIVTFVAKFVGREVTAPESP